MSECTFKPNISSRGSKTGGSSKAPSAYSSIASKRQPVPPVKQHTGEVSLERQKKGHSAKKADKSYRDKD